MISEGLESERNIKHLLVKTFFGLELHVAVNPSATGISRARNVSV
jgi:hypothetical protein